MEDTLINFGSDIKSLGETADGAMKFGAWLVLYGSPEATDASNLRDYFTKSTDFDFEDGDKTTVYWNHGLDPELKRRKLGTATLHKKDAGVWMEGILKARDDYEAKIQDMIKAGKLGASSGVPSHLVERKSVNGAHEILLWPLGKDASLTHTPAEWRTSAHALKSLEEAGELPAFSDLEVEHEAGVDELDAMKKYNPRQPRDDSGQWTSGGSAGQISVSHAIHVMKHEGITDPKYHEQVTRAIENGTHKTREEVLTHIDGIHLQNGTKPSDTGASWILRDDALDDFVDPFDDDSDLQLTNREKDAARDYYHGVSDKVGKETRRDMRASIAQRYDGRDIVDIAHERGDSLESFDDVAKLMGYHSTTWSDQRNMTRRAKKQGLAGTRKSDDETDDLHDTPELKQFSELSDGLRDGLSFPEFAAKVRDAVADAVKHIEGFADVRCVKSQRRWSAANHQALIELIGRFEKAAQEIKSVTDDHAPKPAAESKAEIPPETLQALAAHQMRIAQANGVLV